MGFKYYIAFLKVSRKLKSSLSKQYKYRNSFFRSFLNWFHARVRGLAPTRNVLVLTMILYALMCLKVATVGTCMNMYESDDETHSDAETSDYSDDE